uniref:2'-5' RNA ligase n=1 Tax=uncultured bacterium pAW1 TaxID=1781155 RepID=A0A1C9U4Q5_9BACT|nr:hypothetical protein [uncultured bacterium pAW1]
MLGYNSEDIEAVSPNRYAVVMLLPEGLDQMIAPIREKYDPDFNAISAHISVVFPFQTNKTLDDVSRVVKRVTEKTKSIQVELSSIGDFYPNFPIVFWCVKRNQQIDELYKSLYAGLDLALPHKQFFPHVTVAREISQHRVMMVKEKIVPYLSDETFSADSVELVSPVANRQWVSVRTFPFRG